jgi:molybdopterin/thiamine biosynthesis adenylyltransferase
MFRGGVFLDHASPDHTVALAQERPGSMRRLLLRVGAREGAIPEHALHLHVGRRPPPGARLVCFADGWDAVVAPKPPAEDVGASGNEISGALAAAMAVSEAFRIAVLSDLKAGRRSVRLSAWDPAGHQRGPEKIPYLPKAVWLLGLGNLGQATAFVLGLLPYRDTGEVRLLLQDFDKAGPENLLVQILTEHSWIGTKKVRAAAAWAENRGFEVDISERAFRASDGPRGSEPRVLLCGVDNLDARRAAAAGGFDLMIDAGLGGSAAEAFDLRIHTFPGARTAAQAWPSDEGSGAIALATRELPAGLEKAVQDGILDRCGAITIAGKSVGVPCTALAAGALQVGQLCRALGTGSCCDLVDLSLADVSRASSKVMSESLSVSLSFVRAR